MEVEFLACSTVRLKKTQNRGINMKVNVRIVRGNENKLGVYVTLGNRNIAKIISMSLPDLFGVVASEACDTGYNEFVNCLTRNGRDFYRAELEYYIDFVVRILEKVGGGLFCGAIEELRELQKDIAG